MIIPLVVFITRENSKGNPQQKQKEEARYKDNHTFFLFVIAFLEAALRMMLLQYCINELLPLRFSACQIKPINQSSYTKDRNHDSGGDGSSPVRYSQEEVPWIKFSRETIPSRFREGRKARLPEETFRQTADPSERKAHHLFSFAQSQHSTPPKFPRKGKNQKKELGEMLIIHCLLHKRTIFFLGNINNETVKSNRHLSLVTR